MNTSEQFILFLQSSITPVALISGVGLLLLTITNRLARTIDRSRKLITMLENPELKKRDQRMIELDIMYTRSRYLRNSIGSIVVSIFLNGLIIPILFFMSLYEIDLRFLGYVLFFTSITGILIGLFYFMKDITLTLKALKLEAGEYLKVP
jgi:hypothetical protein